MIKYKKTVTGWHTQQWRKYVTLAFHEGEFVPRILYTSIRGKRTSGNQIDNSSNMFC